MEHRENTVSSGRTPDQEEVVRLIDQALKEGVIRCDRLQPYLERLKVPPENVAKLYDMLRAKHIQVIPEVKDPVYTPEQRQRILELLEQYGDEISERKRLILTLRIAEGKSLTQTAGLTGLNRERVCQIERNAVRMLTRSRTPDEPTENREIYN